MPKSIIRAGFAPLLLVPLLAAAAGHAPEADPGAWLGPPLDDEALAQQAGRQGLDLGQIASSEASASLADNQLVAGSNGGNLIDGSAFYGSAGITSVIQNSGNQVVIQESTAVNVTLTP